jgi:hypothetical protein
VTAREGPGMRPQIIRLAVARGITEDEAWRQRDAAAEERLALAEEQLAAARADLDLVEGEIRAGRLPVTSGGTCVHYPEDAPAGVLNCCAQLAGRAR